MAGGERKIVRTESVTGMGTDRKTELQRETEKEREGGERERKQRGRGRE